MTARTATSIMRLSGMKSGENTRMKGVFKRGATGVDKTAALQQFVRN